MSTVQFYTSAWYPPNMGYTFRQVGSMDILSSFSQMVSKNCNLLIMPTSDATYSYYTLEDYTSNTITFGYYNANTELFYFDAYNKNSGVTWPTASTGVGVPGNWFTSSTDAAAYVTSYAASAATVLGDVDVYIFDSFTLTDLDIFLNKWSSDGGTTITTT